MRIALVGPPLCGKTALFTAVTGVDADPSKYHGARPQPGMVKVPDARLDRLAAHYKPAKTTHAQLEVLDFASIEPGARTENIKQVLAGIRESGDVLAMVLPCFGDNKPEGLKKLFEAMRSEFLFADLEQIERRIEKLETSVKKPTKTQDQDKRELAVLQQMRAHLEEHENLDGLTLDDNQEKLVRGFRFLMQKPYVVVVNADDPAAADPATHLAGVPGALALNADIEREVRGMPEAERGPFLAEFGIAEPAAPRIIAAAYAAAGLQSFFTVGEDECRAWTIEIGDNAQTAAGKIHSDLAKGFVRAVVFAYADFVELGDEKEIKNKGRLREEGKEYVVKDGDVLNIRSSL